MQQFEIKIFANPSGFQELKLTNAEHLFTKEIVEKRNFDGDYGTFKEGTFSVLFAPKAFIIDYIFNVVADAGFRDPQTHIAIAIERGYILKDAYQVFTKLRKEFNLIAAEHKANITRTLYNKNETFNKIIEENIEFAPDQYRISASEIDVTKRALASYETEEQLNSLLEEPNRLKFKSYSLVYFLKKIDASELYKKESINKFYTGIVMDESDFNFQTSYEVVFPDNYSTTIKSRTDVIDHTCTKMYYKSERFCGTLNDHMEDWEVTQSEDRMKFIIGKKLIPETKELQISCYDAQNKPIATPKTLIFSHGTFDTQRSILLLTGEEIDKDFVCSSEDKGIKPMFIERKGDVIDYRIIRRYRYDISAVFSYVNKITKEDINEVKIYKKKTRMPLVVLTRSNSTYYSELTPDNLECEIPETKRFSATRTEFGSDCRPYLPQLQKKDTVDVELVIKDESIVNNLEKKPARCSFRTAHDDSEKHPQVKLFDEKGHLVLKEIPFGKFSYKIEIDGYKPEEDELDLYPKDRTKQIELTFEKTAWKKTLGFMTKHKGNVAILLIGLVIGGFLRPYLDEKLNLPHNNNNRNMDLLRVERDSLLTLTKILKNDTTILGQKNDSLELKIVELETTVDNYKEAINQVQELARGINNEETHPNEIRNILTQMSNKDIENLKVGRTNKNWFYKNVYNKLNNVERKDLDMILDNDVYYSTFISDNNRVQTFKDAKTFKDAINIIKIKSGL